MTMHSTLRRAGAILFVALCLWLPLAQAAPAATAEARIGILVVAPDRGFLGNEEVADALATLTEYPNRAVLYVTDARSEAVLDARLAELRAGGAERTLVLPLVIGPADPRWQLAARWLDARKTDAPHLLHTGFYGDSYLAAEDLAERLRAVATDKQRLLLVGYGAGTRGEADAMAAELRRLAAHATTLPDADIDAIVHPGRSASEAVALQERFRERLARAGDELVVPVALAPRDDTMMDFAGSLPRRLPAQAQLVSSPLAEAPAFAQWMRRAAGEALLQADPPASDEVGVVVLAHGADWFWNEAVRTALADSRARQPLAFAFSMADPPIIERAIRQLEAEHVRAIVVVRVFALASSFAHTVEHLLGEDVRGLAGSHQAHDMDMHAGHDSHGTHGHAAPAWVAQPRIRTMVPTTSVGGVEDAAEFAAALLASARGVSTDPARETVILVAHGRGEDEEDQHWMSTLASLAAQMRAAGGSEFREIDYATWREDWPEKRAPAVARIRSLVERAQQDGGRVLLVPARLNGSGGSERFLDGVEFTPSNDGFVQMPAAFAAWFDGEVVRGRARLQQTGMQPAMMPAGHAHAAASGYTDRLQPD